MRKRVEEEAHARVRLQDGRRDVRRDGAFERGLHRRRLAFVGHHAEDVAALQNLLHRHAQGLRGHLIETPEPAFAHLLPPARLVQVHDEVGPFGGEVGRRIVEGEMAVLADAAAAQVDRRRADGRRCLVKHLRRLALAVEQVRRSDGHAAEQPLLQVLPETGLVAERQSQVLVEVERIHLLPRHIRAGDERLEEAELRRTRRDDDARPAAGLHGLDDRLRHFRSCRSAERRSVGMNRDSHCARL